MIDNAEEQIVSNKRNITKSTAISIGLVIVFVTSGFYSGLKIGTLAKTTNDVVELLDEHILESKANYVPRQEVEVTLKAFVEQTKSLEKSIDELKLEIKEMRQQRNNE